MANQYKRKTFEANVLFFENKSGYSMPFNEKKRNAEIFDNVI